MFLSLFIFSIGINLGFIFEISYASSQIPQVGSCADIFREANISRYFASHVGHAIHSMNVETLRKFEPDFDAGNFVPTVDLNLLSATPILPHAPVPEKSDFKTEGMRVLDRVLSHMNNPAWDVKNYNALERLFHQFHMNEKWFFIREEYSRIKLAPPSKELCQCALDEETNGILNLLRFIALAFREPELVYGQSGVGSENKNIRKTVDRISYPTKDRKKNNFYKSLPLENSEPQKDQLKQNSHLGEKRAQIFSNGFYKSLPLENSELQKNQSSQNNHLGEKRTQIFSNGFYKSLPLENSEPQKDQLNQNSHLGEKRAQIFSNDFYKSLPLENSEPQKDQFNQNSQLGEKQAQMFSNNFYKSLQLENSEPQNDQSNQNSHLGEKQARIYSNDFYKSLQLENPKRQKDQLNQNSQLGEKQAQIFANDFYKSLQSGNSEPQKDQLNQNSQLGEKRAKIFSNGFYESLHSDESQFHGDQANLDVSSLDNIRKAYKESYPASNNEAAWKLWLGSPKLMQEGDRDVAVYLYCAHQRANRYKQRLT